MRQYVCLTRETKGSAALVEEATARIRAFSHRFGSKAPDTLVNGVWKLYAERSPALGLWVLLDPGNGAVIGHLLLDARTWDGATVGWVSQVELDGTPLTRAERDHGIGEIEAWAERWNRAAEAQGRPDAKIEEFWMSTPRNAEVWARAFGFHVQRALCSRRIR
jgi:hypothetical protein